MRPFFSSLFSIQTKPRQHLRDLGSGGLAPGIKDAAALAGKDALLHRPAQGVPGVTAGLAGVGEIQRQVRRRGASGVPPEQGSKLLSGNGIIGPESALPISLNHARLRRPGDGPGVPPAVCHIREGLGGFRLRLTLHPPEDGGDHGPAGGHAGGEMGAVSAHHQAALKAVVDAVVIPRAQAGILVGPDGTGLVFGAAGHSAGILYAEGEALSSLLSQVDAGDVRVNTLEAFVIPQSRLVMRGGKYSANIVLAAIDSTARPKIYIGDKPLENSLYELPAGATGSFTYKGYMEVPHGDGSVTRHDFESAYTVIEPMATVSATMMNVLYAGIDNPISISVPGVAMKDISASMTNGTLTRSGDHWVARPAGIGKEAVVNVTATIDGRTSSVAQTSFRVRKLPDPTAYIAYNDGKGNIEHYKGGKPISKALLMAAPGLEAAIDDGLLDTKFRVISFETIAFDSMGNAMPEVSDGANFSQRQKQVFRSLSRGKRFFISRIRAAGPDGTTRDLSPMEVIVN